MMDEVACDGRMCYSVRLGGLCEHSESELTSIKMGNFLEVIRSITKAVRDEKVHLVVNEVLVVAIAQNDETDYGTKPALLKPTCKRGSSQHSSSTRTSVETFTFR